MFVKSYTLNERPAETLYYIGEDPITHNVLFGCEVDTVEGTTAFDVNTYLTPQGFTPDVKTQLLKAIKLEKVNTNKEPITVNSMSFDVRDNDDKENIQGTIDNFDLLADPVTGTVTWTLADNTEAQVSLADFQAVVSAYAVRKAQAHAKYMLLKAEIEAM